ncbi:MAG: PDZ domain-containing protein [Candidatus Sericytochromatia bacterium]
MNRRILTLMVALAPIVVFGALLGAVRVPYVSLGPGPTFNTLGEVDGKEVVDIEGTQVYPASGHLDMTTVAQRDQLTLGEAVALWMSGREQLVPRDLVYPPDKSRDEVDKDNSAEFEASEDKAKYAALGYLKYSPALTVEVVNDDGPSHGKLAAGDAIEKVNGTPVTGVDQFQDLLKKTRPGDSIVVDYRRKDAPPGTTTITLGQNKDRDYGYVGVAVRDAPWAPFKITFNLANVGGPSAGLMFALAVVDKLTTGELTANKFVAGTGTIDSDGKVGPIGGITHKMLAAHEAGASVFLVPADNCAEARTGNEDGLELVKVETLGQAVDALNLLSAGGEPPRC